MSSKAMSVVIALGLIILLAANSLFIVSERERGVQLRFGQIVKADLKPGLHVKIPFVDRVRIFDGRLQALDVPQARFLTQEQKAVVVDAYIKWQIMDVQKFYKATNGDLFRVNQLLSQRADSRLRNQFGSLTLNEVVSGRRDEMLQEITTSLNSVAYDELGVAVRDVRVKKIDLPSDVSGSVFDRMSSEREKEAQEYRSKGKEMGKAIRASADRERRVILAEAYRKAETLRGDGDAEAAAIYAKAYQQDAEFYSFYRSLRAYRESFNSPSDVLLLEPDSDFFKYLNKVSGK
ncbi:protease modulator HflC [Sansalvadorimonas sp. 2012CJ34-2]|uniref:Protein HflC n=1 Tax=Parendozoicomonas callyspongiae TaxID=2942213 RepID=A0ABT0PKS9_9GAMM|nr:protease modulator HflC [Sansalvadorimonas sp. 2012CJ34-2]MCL6271980.1 protease modulator HflC [Sansalvadorimonas sp. 2012CJ34-2]